MNLLNTCLAKSHLASEKTASTDWTTLDSLSFEAPLPLAPNSYQLQNVEIGTLEVLALESHRDHLKSVVLPWPFLITHPTLEEKYGKSVTVEAT